MDNECGNDIPHSRGEKRKGETRRNLPAQVGELLVNSLKSHCCLMDEGYLKGREKMPAVERNFADSLAGFWACCLFSQGGVSRKKTQVGMKRRERKKENDKYLGIEQVKKGKVVDSVLWLLFFTYTRRYVGEKEDSSRDL
jgi:hypothetical protein